MRHRACLEFRADLPFVHVHGSRSTSSVTVSCRRKNPVVLRPVVQATLSNGDETTLVARKVATGFLIRRLHPCATFGKTRVTPYVAIVPGISRVSRFFNSILLYFTFRSRRHLNLFTSSPFSAPDICTALYLSDCHHLLSLYVTSNTVVSNHYFVSLRQST